MARPAGRSAGPVIHTGRTRWERKRHVWRDRSNDGRAHPPNPAERLERAERAERVTIGHDALRERRTDPRELLDLRCAGAVEIDPSSRGRGDYCGRRHDHPGEHRSALCLHGVAQLRHPTPPRNAGATRLRAWPRPRLRSPHRIDLSDLTGQRPLLSRGGPRRSPNEHGPRPDRRPEHQEPGEKQQRTTLGRCDHARKVCPRRPRGHDEITPREAKAR
jgi:hypothetical protein